MFENRAFSAFLFDMDGTLLSSIASAERIWTAWARGHGIDPGHLLATMHGVRAIETVARHVPPGIDARTEADRITLMEIEDAEGTEAITGAGAFLRSLPADRWAIVTSAPRPLALARLRAAGLPMPETIVTADDVSVGKPEPEGYLLAAARLGFSASDCLVFEDAHAGIVAGEAAGATVCVVTACLPVSFATDRATLANYEQHRVAIDSATGDLRIIDL
ncbi:HAD-IA family hydrolase [Sphingomonas sp.]|uniref:HAD-IA family hydrolase n=1 Tax=Sphingomonas sp. TaxID=28214 RepID=UPI000DB7524D|nr:HAD-IA family hydrolase [Sphingomonas sp.]PZU07471.1 MAG: glycerol-3-phosphatase [Sphingomonas sp.]